MKRVRLVNPDGVAHHTRLIDVDTGEEIKGVVRLCLTQEAGGPPMVRYETLAIAELDLVRTLEP